MRPHKIPSRGYSQPKRPTHERSGDLFLIVCEGAKTEPAYFKSLTQQWRLSSASIIVCGEECGSAPISVVDYAIQRKEAKHPFGVPFDQVWCVIDKDDHTTTAEAIARAKGSKINIAVSVPCFEIWFLLHFCGDAKPRKNCREIERELKTHLPGKAYKKAVCPFDQLHPKTDVAIRHAEFLRREREIRPNPATDVDLLVKALMELRVPGL